MEAEWHYRFCRGRQNTKTPCAECWLLRKKRPAKLSARERRTTSVRKVASNGFPTSRRSFWPLAGPREEEKVPRLRNTERCNTPHLPRRALRQTKKKFATPAPCIPRSSRLVRGAAP